MCQNYDPVERAFEVLNDGLECNEFDDCEYLVEVIEEAMKYLAEALR